MSRAQVESLSVATATAPAAQPDRDGNGRFTVGNAGGPGNPFARRTAALRQKMLKAAEERLDKVIDQLFTMAEAGNLAAVKLIFQYTQGKPEAPVNPDRLDVEEWQHYKETAGMMVEMPKLVDKPDPVLPLTAVRQFRVDATRNISGRMGDVLRDPEAFHAAEEKAREAHFRQLERDSLGAAAKYDGFVPDETGLPPEVKPIQPKANGKNGGQGGQGGQRKATPKANGKNGGRRPPRPESPVAGPAAPQNTGGGGRPPSPNRFIQGLPDWCPPIPVSDEPLADPEPPSPFGKNGK